MTAFRCYSFEIASCLTAEAFTFAKSLRYCIIVDSTFYVLTRCPGVPWLYSTRITFICSGFGLRTQDLTCSPLSPPLCCLSTGCRNILKGAEIVACLLYSKTIATPRHVTCRDYIPTFPPCLMPRRCYPASDGCPSMLTTEQYPTVYASLIRNGLCR